MKPEFKPGKNIAMKVPSHEYLKTVAFYRDVLGFKALSSDAPESTRFEFGDKILWIDKVSSLSKAEIWLEIVTSDLALAAKYFESSKCIRRDEIEPLPDGFEAFWLSNPSNIIHLVSGVSS